MKRRNLFKALVGATLAPAGAKALPARPKTLLAYDPVFYAGDIQWVNYYNDGTMPRWRLAEGHWVRESFYTPEK